MGRLSNAAGLSRVDCAGLPSTRQQWSDQQRFVELLGRGPLTALCQPQRDFRSAALNTDALGLRYSYCAGRRHSVAERGGRTRVNLLVGGSCALGLGASSDTRTLASFLSLLSGEVWLSLASCGLTSRDELALFLAQHKRLRGIGQVVIVSGLNTLAQVGLTDLAPSLADDTQPVTLGAFHEGRRAIQDTPLSIWQRLGRYLAPGQPTPAPLRVPVSAAQRRMDQAADELAQTLLQWQALLAGSDSQLTFMLQPWLPWCRTPSTATASEREVLATLQARPTPFEGLLSGLDKPGLHAAFFDRVRRQAESVPCFDLNRLLSNSPVFCESLFVDSLHCNDLGYNALAKVITARLGLAARKTTSRRVISCPQM